MMCPLFTLAWLLEAEKVEEDYKNCAEKQCAWWDPYERRCAIFLIAQR